MAEKEYIEREALEKFVSGIRRNLPLESPDFITRDYMLLNFEQYIHLMPAADVVEVVRCKDCKYRKTEDCAMFYECNCGEQHTWETDNDFCSYGERRADNG